MAAKQPPKNVKVLAILRLLKNNQWIIDRDTIAGVTETFHAKKETDASIIKAIKEVVGFQTNGIVHLISHYQI